MTDYDHRSPKVSWAKVSMVLVSFDAKAKDTPSFPVENYRHQSFSKREFIDTRYVSRSEFLADMHIVCFSKQKKAFT